MTLIRVSMIIDSSRLTKILDNLTSDDALSVGIMEVNKMPAVPRPSAIPAKRPVGRPRGAYKRRSAASRIDGKTSPNFVLAYAKQHPTFHVRKELMPAAVAAGFKAATVHGTCSRLARDGVLKRTGQPGCYMLTVPIEPEPDKVT